MKNVLKIIRIYLVGVDMKAYVLRSFGGPEVLRVEEIERPRPE